MSNKWILIKLADEFGLQVYENKIFGQLNNTNQLVKIESGFTSPIFSAAFKLSPSLNVESLKEKIQVFNKKRMGKAFVEDNLLVVGNIYGTLTNPKRHYEILHEVVSWWSEELSRFQKFERFSKIALYKTGPDKDEMEVEEKNKIEIEKDNANSDDRKSLVAGISLSILCGIAVGVVAGILRNQKIGVFPLEMIFVLGLVGKSFKVDGKGFRLKSLILISCVFIVVFVLEQFVNVATFYYLIKKFNFHEIGSIYSDSLVRNYKWFLWPLFIVGVPLILKIAEYKSPHVVRGRSIDDIDRSLAELKLKKTRISLYTFFSIFLFFIPMFLQIIYILHDVVYPSHTAQFILFALLFPFCFYVNYRVSKKILGRSPFKRHERETKFEVFEDNLGRFITSTFLAATIALSVNVSNVMLDPFEYEKVEGVLKKDYPVKIRSCVILPVKVGKSHEEDFSFCDDVRSPPRSGSKMIILEGQGLFRIKYYKKVVPQS